MCTETGPGPLGFRAQIKCVIVQGRTVTPLGGESHAMPDPSREEQQPDHDPGHRSSDTPGDSLLGGAAGAREGPGVTDSGMGTLDDLGFVREFLLFLRQNKVWWLAPLVVVTLLLLMAALLLPGPVSPFIYTVF